MEISEAPVIKGKEVTDALNTELSQSGYLRGEHGEGLRLVTGG